MTGPGGIDTERIGAGASGARERDPGREVEDESAAAEEGGHHERDLHQSRVDAIPGGDAGAHAGNRPIVGPIRTGRPQALDLLLELLGVHDDHRAARPAPDTSGDPLNCPPENPPGPGAAERTHPEIAAHEPGLTPMSRSRSHGTIEE